MKSLQIPTHLSIHLDYELVSWGSRLGGFLIDWGVKWFYFLIINLTILDKWEAPSLVVLLLYLPFILYSFFFEWFNNGRSLGKLLSKSRVISANGQPATIYQILTRWLFNMVDVFGIFLLTVFHDSLYIFMVFSPLIGGLIIIFTKNNQRLGDLAAGTLVVSTRETNVSLEQTVYKYAKNIDTYTPTYPEIMRLSDRDMSKIQQIMERGDFSQNEELIERLATHVRKILKIETDQSDIIFLNTLLSDYNHYAKLDSGEVA
ncbi:Uncharacterized membrane protein YckC, RDD family [Spirosomataceae bacterium TFI 002]|nr:Uncharacterized membrane protein YckC, RDD family [Spirosomataceae bacterium TFI 002]